MSTETITVRLRLSGLVVLGTVEESDRIEVEARFESEEEPCPRCGRKTWQVHQWSRQRKRDAPLWLKPVFIVLWKRRFRCRACRHVFTEDDRVCGRRRRSTRRLRGQFAREAQEASVRAVSRWHGVSESLVGRSWLEFFSQVEASTRPHVLLGLDGFCVRRPGVMWTGIWDLQTRRPVAVMKGERRVDIQRLLERHADPKSVKAVATDLSEANRQAVQMVLPDTLLVADKFHVTAVVHRALQEVRGGRRLTGNTAWLMHRNVGRLSQADADRLGRELGRNPQLKTAWLLKEGLHEVYRSRTRDQAENRLDDWIGEARRSGLEAASPDGERRC